MKETKCIYNLKTPNTINNLYKYKIKVSKKKKKKKKSVLKIEQKKKKVYFLLSYHGMLI